MLSGVFGTRSLAVETQNIQAIFLRGAHSSNRALAPCGVQRKVDKGNKGRSGEQSWHA